MRERNSVLYDKYLVQDLDLNIYKCIIGMTKDVNLYIQPF